MSESETPNFAGFTRQAVTTRARPLATAIGEALSELLGGPLGARSADVHIVGKDNVADGDVPLLHQLCKTAGEPSQPVHMLASRESAAALAGLQMGRSEEEVSASAKEELDDDTRSAFQQLMQAVAGTIAKELAEDGCPEIEARDAREVPEPLSDPTWLDGDDFVRMRVDLSHETHGELRLDLLLPHDPNDVPQDVSALRCVFVECQAEEFERLDVIAGDVEFEMVVAQPQTLLDDLEEEAEEISLIVVPWELAGRSGLEFVEDLVGHEGLEHAAFAISSPFPTRDRVAAARRAGASAVMLSPYDRDDIERRLVPLMAAAAAARPVSENAEPAAETEAATEAPEEDGEAPSEEPSSDDE